MAFKILYIGNMLSKHGFNPTSVDTLTPKLRELAVVESCCTCENQYLRLTNIVLKVLQAKADTIILIDTYSTASYWFARITGFIAYLRGMKYIPFLHGGNLPTVMTQKPVRFKFFLDHASLLLAPSEFVLTTARKLSNVPTAVVPNFIEQSKYPFKLRNGAVTRILWVRAFHEIYLPEDAIRILDVLVSRGLDVELIMVGPDKDGSLHSCISLAHDLGLKLKVNFPGKLSKNEWIELAGDCDLFLNTTSVDNAPVTIVEAMALGLPIVSTDVGGLPYILKNEETVLFYRKGNINEAADMILRLNIDTKLTTSLSKNGRKAADYWDWDKSVRNIWNNILSSSALR